MRGPDSGEMRKKEGKRGLEKIVKGYDKGEYRHLPNHIDLNYERKSDLEESSETTEGGEEDTWGGVGHGTVRSRG